MTGSSAPPNRRNRTRDRLSRQSPAPGAFGLLALVVMGLIATTFSVRTEHALMQRRQGRAADLVESRLNGALLQTLGTVQGAGAMGADGRVGEAEFAAFAHGVVNDSMYQALAYATIVTASERKDFQASTGLTIGSTDGQGGFVDADAISRSLVVVDVYPRSDATIAMLGFDLASDPIRRRAAMEAEQSISPTISDRTVTAGGARPGFSVMQAVRGPDGTTIGFLSSGFAIDGLVERAGIDTATFANFGLSIDGEVLTGSMNEGALRSFEAAGRTFAVVVDDGQGMSPTMPLLIGSSTAVLAAVVTNSLRRERAQRDRLALGARRSRGIAELGRLLAASGDSSAVVGDVSTHAGPVLDGARTNVLRRSSSHPSGLAMHHDADVPVDSAGVIVDPMVLQSLRQCIRTERTVVVLGEPNHRGDAKPSIASICVPLMFSEGFCAGALAFAWDDPMSSCEADERAVAAATMAELAGRALERTVMADAVQSGAGNLSSFAQALAATHTADDVRQAVRRHVAPILSAHLADLELAGSPAPVGHDPRGRIRRTIEDCEQRTIADLVVHWRGAAVPTTTQHALLSTLAELISQTLARTALVEQEHRVIVQLQRDLLPPPPPVPGLEIVVDYQPAMNVVGLGGDFYDVVVSDTDRIYLVIGDITGHGSEAVAAMAELKSVVHHLLRSDASIPFVCEQADLILSRRAMFATAQIAEIDLESQTLRYVNAGHPYPVLRRADGNTTQLRDGHRALLGLFPPIATTTTALIPFYDGDALVLYTDGLIERRSHEIDDAMDELRRTIERSADGRSQGLVDLLMTADRAPDIDDRVDDDIAIIGVRRVT